MTKCVILFPFTQGQATQCNVLLYKRAKKTSNIWYEVIGATIYKKKACVMQIKNYTSETAGKT